MNDRTAFLLVGTGGAFGAATRYGADTVFPSLVSTLVVNVAGCFALGYILYASRFDAIPEQGRIFAATGFLSSFTTYSTFVVDAFTSRPVVAVVYIVVSYLLGFAAVAAGSAVATRHGRVVA